MPGMFLHKFADADGNLDTSQGHGGVEHVGTPTAYAEVATSLVSRGIAEGWILPENEEVVHRPGGPPDDPWRVTHTFRHFSHLTIAGEIYQVVHQPDKYADYEQVTGGAAIEPFIADDDTPVGPPDGEIYTAGATRVDHFYGLERIPNEGA